MSMFIFTTPVVFSSPDAGVLPTRSAPIDH